jgi:hypothetical protein
LFSTFRATAPPSTSHEPKVTCGMQEDTTADPVVADIRNFYKVELWTREYFIERLLFAGRSLDTARDVFTEYALRQPTARLTIRQRMRVLTQWPRSDAPPDF